MPNTTYPTRDQILAEPLPTFKPEVLRTVREWKREYRGTRRSQDAITALLSRLAACYAKPVNINYAEPTFIGDHYNPATRTITLTPSRLSVVTALHEMAHHLFGRSELKACRWSVHLFRRTFARSYAALDWDGHMLRVRARRDADAPVRDAADLTARIRAALDEVRVDDSQFHTGGVPRGSEPPVVDPAIVAEAVGLTPRTRARRAAIQRRNRAASVPVIAAEEITRADWDAANPGANAVTADEAFPRVTSRTATRRAAVQRRNRRAGGAR